MANNHPFISFSMMGLQLTFTIASLHTLPMNTSVQMFRLQFISLYLNSHSHIACSDPYVVINRIPYYTFTLMQSSDLISVSHYMFIPMTSQLGAFTVFVLTTVMYSIEQCRFLNDNWNKLRKKSNDKCVCTIGWLYMNSCLPSRWHKLELWKKKCLTWMCINVADIKISSKKFKHDFNRVQASHLLNCPKATVFLKCPLWLPQRP